MDNHSKNALGVTVIWYNQWMTIALYYNSGLCPPIPQHTIHTLPIISSIQLPSTFHRAIAS